MNEPKLRSLTRGYVDETLELLGDRDPIVVLEETPAWIAQRTDHLSGSALQRPEGEGKWSLVQVFAHLADTEVVFGWRARLTLTEDRPPITGFNENRWVDRFDYAGADPTEALHVFATLRRWNLRVWRAATPADHLNCIGMHSERGEESFDRLIRMTAGHDLRHRRQIDRLLAAVT
jgi:uncharacterized damage-inducible protein DinB